MEIKLIFVSCWIRTGAGRDKKLYDPTIPLLLLLSRFSRVQLCVTPSTAAYQAPPSMGFSRQEYWSGVPLHYWAYIWRKPQFKRHMYLSVHCSAIYCSQDMEVT